MVWLVVILDLLIVLYLVLRFNRYWIYRLFDRALRNPRDHLPPQYEVPRYLVRDDEGNVDRDARWPGWDGWYFFVLPEGMPLRMIRGSVMTGLYCLKDIDNYEKLEGAGLSPFGAVEYLNLVHTEDEAGQKITRQLQTYQPKLRDLIIEAERLFTEIRDRSNGSAAPDSNESPAPELYCRVTGTWPEYSFEFANPDIGMSGQLSFRGECLVWWADVPGLFTYFASFGRFEGSVRVAEPGRAARDIAITGPGCFEHGFARKSRSYDVFYSPVRLIKRVFPRFAPIRYHYEIIITDGNIRGGFMSTYVLGLDIRDRGGMYLGDTYIPIHHIEIEYMNDPPPERGEGRTGAMFYRRWRVCATTDEGPLVYEARREWPAQGVTSNMYYYYFAFEGSYRGQAIKGGGFGEYLHI